MRPGAWFLLPLLTSASAAASSKEGMGRGPEFQRRTLMLASRTGRVPPLELHVAAGVATLVRFDVPLLTETPEFPGTSERIHRVHVGEGSWVFVPTTDLGAGEQVVLTFSTGPEAEPLRVVLVTRRDAVDLRVDVVRGPAEVEGTDPVARSLLDAPDARPLLDVPRGAVDSNVHDARGRVDSDQRAGNPRSFRPVSPVRSSGARSSPFCSSSHSQCRA